MGIGRTKRGELKRVAKGGGAQKSNCIVQNAGVEHIAYNNIKPPAEGRGMDPEFASRTKKKAEKRARPSARLFPPSDSPFSREWGQD